MRRRTREEILQLIATITALKLQQVPPAVILSQLVTDHGLSLRHARRYLARISERIREEAPADSADPFDQTAAMALRRLQFQMLNASPSELPRLITALAKLREVCSPGPSLSDSEMLGRAAFSGGLSKL